MSAVTRRAAEKHSSPTAPSRPGTQSQNESRDGISTPWTVPDMDIINRGHETPTQTMFWSDVSAERL